MDFNNTEINHLFNRFPYKNLEATACFLETVLDRQRPHCPTAYLNTYTDSPRRPSRSELIYQCCTLLILGRGTELTSGLRERTIHHLANMCLADLHPLQQCDFFFKIIHPMMSDKEIEPRIKKINHGLIKHFRDHTQASKLFLFLSLQIEENIKSFYQNFMLLTVHSDQLKTRLNTACQMFLMQQSKSSVEDLSRHKLIEMVMLISYVITKEDDEYVEGICPDYSFQYSGGVTIPPLLANSLNQRIETERFLILPLIQSTYRMQCALFVLLETIGEYFPHGFEGMTILSRVPHMNREECRKNYVKLVDCYPIVHSTPNLLDNVSRILTGEII